MTSLLGYHANYVIVGDRSEGFALEYRDFLEMFRRTSLAYLYHIDIILRHGKIDVTMRLTLQWYFILTPL